MIGGQAAVIKTAGTYVDDMILKRAAGIKISLLPAQGRSRMSHLATLRKALFAVQDYMVELAEAKKADATADAEPDLKRDAMVRLLRGELPAFLYCERAMDVPRAIELAAEFKLKAILVLGHDCYRAADLVAKSGLPAVLEPTLVFWEHDDRTDQDREIVVPKIYRDAGAKVTYQTAGIAGGTLFQPASIPPLLGRNFLWYQAATAVKYGTPPAEALEAITLRPAKVLGVDKFVGSLEVGKDADLVVLSGEPLKLDTWVETVLVNGRIAYERAKDTKLQQLLAPTKP
jgi:imidazolonepropionase-like amidohydrolase